MSLKRISSCWEPRLWKTGESLPSDSVNLIHIYQIPQIPSKFDWLVYNSSTDVIQTFDFKVGNLEEANRVVTKPFHVQYSFVKFRMQIQITLPLEGTVDRVGSKCLRPTVEIGKILIVIQHDLIYFLKWYVNNNLSQKIFIEKIILLSSMIWDFYLNVLLNMYE